MQHPAKYSDIFIRIFAEYLLLEGARLVLDPMGGTGKLARVKERGFDGIVASNDITDWSDLRAPGVDLWTVSDAAALPYADGLRGHRAAENKSNSPCPTSMLKPAFSR